MKVAVYTRVSTADKGQDTTNQSRQLKEFIAKQEGWELVQEYSDHKSGGTGDRDQFRSLFAAASRREFDVVLFWSLDRLSREGALATMKYLEQFSTWGIQWKSYTEPYLDSMGIFKDVALAMLATVAKQERVRQQERVCAGLERTKAKGTKLGRPPVIHDAKQVFRLYAEGKSMRKIAKIVGISSSSVMNRLRTVDKVALREKLREERTTFQRANPEVVTAGGFKVLPSWLTREPIDDPTDLRNFATQRIPLEKVDDDVL